MNVFGVFGSFPAVLKTRAFEGGAAPTVQFLFLGVGLIAGVVVFVVLLIICSLESIGKR